MCIYRFANVVVVNLYKNLLKAFSENNHAHEAIPSTSSIRYLYSHQLGFDVVLVGSRLLIHLAYKPFGRVGIYHPTSKSEE